MREENRGKEQAGKEHIRKRLAEYNNTIKENDELYRNAAKAMGLSDGAFWILYILRENGKLLTQKEICDALYQPKQTINSALKKLERDGFLELMEMSDRRSKEVHLTEKGKELARKTVDQVIADECEALSELTEEEQKTFLGLFHKYTILLKKSMGKHENLFSI